MLRHCWFICLVLAATSAAVSATAQEGRFTAGIPVYVGHAKDRPGARDWNGGWFENEGVFADVSWPVHPLGERTDLRAGFTVGGFDNSLHDFSVFAGGMAEIETRATERLSFGAGLYAGVITGYETSPAPAVAPYIGTAYRMNEKLELGLRGIWIPAETLAGPELAPSDAYVAAVTVGRRF